MWTKEIEKGIISDKTERIIDRLDLQLLVTVIVFFVSSWAFLNNKICYFTESEPIRTQMNYILVHYILSLVLFLCIFITFIKGMFVLKLEKGLDVSDASRKIISLFIEGWFPTLILCILVLIFSSVIPWTVWAIIALVLLYHKAVRLHISLPSRWGLVFGTAVLFPIFISTMTVVVKDIDIIVDKDYYSVSDKVIVSIDSKGYACKHSLMKLGEQELYPYSEYEKIKNYIIVPATCIKDNVISVGVVSPASGLKHFYLYPFEKMLNKVPEVSLGDEWKGHIYYQSRAINIR